MAMHTKASRGGYDTGHLLLSGEDDVNHQGTTHDPANCKENRDNETGKWDWGWKTIEDLFQRGHITKP